MKILTLMGSPRKNSNTDALLNPFINEFEKLGVEVIKYKTDKMDIHSCIACRNCQKDWSSFNCIFKDDMYKIFDECLTADLILFATPIYSWYCTGSMKNVLDRLVYGMCKYYGDKKGPSLWAGKKIALMITCGYGIDKGADLFIEGMRRYAHHNQLEFIDYYAERHLGYDTEFMDEEKELHSRDYAKRLYEKLT